MSEETKNTEQIKKAEETEQEAKTAELSDRDLDNVAGGETKFSRTKSNVKTS